MPRTSRGLLLAAALAGGCQQSFQNPAQELRAGEVGGQCTAPASAGGVAVSIRGSALDQATRPDGRFGVVPLPRGHHVVLLRQGLTRAALREVDLGYAADGQVDGVWLGGLGLPLAAGLGGALVAPADVPGDGVVVDETTGTAVGTTWGAFQIEGLPIGSHRLFAATRDEGTGAIGVAGPVPVLISEAEQGTRKTLADVLPHLATAATGHLYFRVASLVDGIAPAQAVISVRDAGGVEVPLPAPDSNGDSDLTLAEGLYTVEVRPPAGWEDSVPAPAPAMAVVVADDQFDLGTFYLAEDTTIEASGRSCHADADCAPGRCVTGVCDAGYVLPPAVPANLPRCADLASCWPEGPCDPPGGFWPATCVAIPGPATDMRCIPCSTRCTVDGSVVLSAAACPP